MIRTSPQEGDSLLRGFVALSQRSPADARRWARGLNRGSELTLPASDDPAALLSRALGDDEGAQRALARAEQLLRATSEARVEMVPLYSPAYPRLLMRIPDPPPYLFLTGDSSLLRVRSVAVVGTRRPTEMAREVTRRLTRHLCMAGYCIVSGLALGTDAEAHESALRCEGKTIAVMAGGLDRLSPKANLKLANRIIDRGGLLVSEYPVGTPCKPHQFVARNRIQVGLSLGSIIVECNEDSGSFAQATFAQQFERALFTIIPSPEFSPRMNLAGARRIVADLRGHAISDRNDYPMIERELQAINLRTSEL